MTEDQVIAALKAVAESGRSRRRRRMLLWAGLAVSVWIVTDCVDLLLPSDNLILFLTTYHRPVRDAVCSTVSASGAFF